MERVGDNNAGFTAEAASASEVLVAGWGFWGPEIAHAFAPTVAGICRAMQRGAKLLLDMSDLKPMREEGQQSFRELMESLSGLGVSGVSVVTTNPLTKLQLVRLAKESGTRTPIEWIDETNSLHRS